MSNKNGSETVNTGGASRPTRDEAAEEFEIAGNAKVKGEDPSPGGRDRGETSSADRPAAVDSDTGR